MSGPTRIIDVHQHVFWDNYGDAALVADLDNNGIEKAVLLTWCIAPTEGDYFQGLNPVHAPLGRGHPGLVFSDVLLAKRAYPERFLVGYAPHPLDGRAVELLESAIEMYDVRVCGEWKFRLTLDDPRCLECFGVCGRRGLPVVLHMDVPYRPDETGRPRYDPHWFGGGPEHLQRALAACPQTILIGHGPGFWRHISGDADTAPAGYPSGPVTPGGRLPELLEEYPNLYADLSATSGRNALQRDTEHARDFLLRYHRRVLFGRDQCNNKLHELLQSLDLPEDVTEDIYHRNAERLLGIET